MNQELDEKLCDKYPKIFVDRNGDMKTTAMVWGFECGNGWYEIIDNLCEKIQSYTDETIGRDVEVEQTIAVQVKEKFGTLRFYIHGGDNHIDTLIDEAEILSSKICDVCSMPGKARGVYWVSVRCDDHTGNEFGYD